MCSHWVFQGSQFLETLVYVWISVWMFRIISSFFVFVGEGVFPQCSSIPSSNLQTPIQSQKFAFPWWRLSMPQLSGTLVLRPHFHTQHHPIENKNAQCHCSVAVLLLPCWFFQLPYHFACPESCHPRQNHLKSMSLSSEEMAHALKLKREDLLSQLVKWTVEQSKCRTISTMFGTKSWTWPWVHFATQRPVGHLGRLKKWVQRHRCQGVDQRFIRDNSSVQQIEVQRLFEILTWVHIDLSQNMLIFS